MVVGNKWEVDRKDRTQRHPRHSRSRDRIPSLCPLQVPTFIPVIMLLVSLYLVLAPIIDHPQMEFLYIFLFVLTGFPVYFLLFHFQCQSKCVQTATMHLQLLLEVAPTIKDH